MKKKFRLAFILLFSMTAFFSCKKEKPAPITPVESHLYEMIEMDTIINPLDIILNLGSLAGDTSININEINTSVVPNGISVQDAISYLLSNWSGIVTGKMYYSSKDVAGNPKTLSGRVYVYLDNTKDLRGIILASHFTKAADRECPSNRILQLEAIYSILGYAVVMPDYIGYGKTVDMGHPYLDWASTAQSCIDSYLAAREYLEDNGYNIGDEIYNIGYSQGGSSAMATLRMVTESYSDKIQFTKSFMGGGVYDIEATFDDVVEKNFTGIPYGMPMIINGLDCAQNLNLNLDDIFIGKTRENYRLVLSKQYDADELNEILTDNKATDIFNAFMFDKTHPVTSKIMEAARKNRLTDTWTPNNGEDISILHSTTDDMVPYINSELMNEALENTGCELEFISGDFGPHKAGAVLFFINILGYLIGL